MVGPWQKHPHIFNSKEGSRWMHMLAIIKIEAIRDVNQGASFTQNVESWGSPPPKHKQFGFCSHWIGVLTPNRLQKKLVLSIEHILA